MDSELKLIQLIDNDGMDETFVYPSLLMILYITFIHILFYNFINDYVLCVISLTIVILIFEHYYCQIEDISDELKDS